MIEKSKQEELKMEEKRNLAKIKKRILIGAIAIFVVSCYELWRNPSITHVAAVLMSIYISVSISALGYIFIKKMMTFYLKKNKK